MNTPQKELNAKLKKLEERYLFGTITLSELVRFSASAGLEAAKQIVENQKNSLPTQAERTV